LVTQTTSSIPFLDDSLCVMSNAIFNCILIFKSVPSRVLVFERIRNFDNSHNPCLHSLRRSFPEGLATHLVDRIKSEWSPSQLVALLKNGLFSGCR
jgi:hypothetical protein